MRSSLSAAGIAIGVAVAAALAIAAEPPTVVRAHCVSDTLGRTSCARDERGVAVAVELGDVRCAAGECIRADSAEATDWDGEWICSDVPGGTVHLTPDGPRCDGTCRPPRATECVQH